MRANRIARRLACYLDAVGIRPALTGLGYKSDCRALSIQYAALPLPIRREARRQGREIVRHLGLKVASSKLYPAVSAPTPNRTENKECAKGLDDLLSRSLGRCPRCKSWGRPKRSWPNRETAEAFRLLAQDMLLDVYECPVRPGCYHLGHKRKPA